MMTKAEYLECKMLDPQTLTSRAARDMDTLVKHEALRRLELNLQGVEPAIADFVRVCVKVHYGSAECDTMLQLLGAYPDWM